MLEGKVREGRAHPAEIEDARMLFRADHVVYNGETEDLHAEGHVYYESFVNKEKLWCDKVDYHTEKGHEHGVFTGHVVGETQPRIITKPGILTSSAPFHFEGEWAERDEIKYIVHNGWVTNCTLPKPWWKLRGPKFDIIPHQRAKAYDSVFLVDGIPVFFFPWFYHPLQREPRKSGFLLPSPFHNSLRGWGVGMGYYWAINRSYDATYEAQVFDSGLITHHAEFRGKPMEGTGFDIVAFGSAGGPNYSPSGATVYGEGKSRLGDGWTAAGTLNYTSTLLFRQDWSQSYSETVGSEISSSAFLNKNWSTYTFDVEMSRDQSFLNVEQYVTNPATGKTSLGPADAVTIRKLPEAELSSRDHDIFHGLPLWFSFEASSGMLSRYEPFFNSTLTQVTGQFQTGFFTDRTRLAPHLTTAFHLGPVHFVPSIGLDETFYSESQTVDGNHAVATPVLRSSGDFSLDAIFPSLERIYNKKSFLGDKVKHVIEPRATYLYVTGVGSDFNRYILFDQNDLRANTNQIELSLANRLYAKRGDNVLEVFSWEIKQQYYFDPTFGGALSTGQRNVFESTAALSGYAFLVGPRSYSPVVSTIRATPLSGLSIQWQTDYDPLQHGIVNSALSAEYRWRKKYFLSGGNNEVHSNPLLTSYANQFRMRAVYGVTNNRGFNTGVDAYYDYRQQKLLYATAQVTYNTDCCGLSVQFRRVYRLNLPDENLYYVSFSVANIGAVGSLKKQDRLF
jgi:LPS-assembly protein